MADQKSKLPDFNEITGMAGKLFGDIKSSITDIIKDYKEKHAVEANAPASASQEAPSETTAPKAKAEKVEEAKAAPATEETKPEDTKSE